MVAQPEKGTRFPDLVRVIVTTPTGFVFARREMSAKHGAGQLTFPGGKIGDNYVDETPVAAARREVEEETSFNVPFLVQRGVNDFGGYRNHLFHAHGEGPFLTMEEGTEIRVFSYHRTLAMIFFSSLFSQLRIMGLIEKVPDYREREFYRLLSGWIIAFNHWKILKDFIESEYYKTLYRDATRL